MSRGLILVNACGIAIIWVFFAQLTRGNVVPHPWDLAHAIVSVSGEAFASLLSTLLLSAAAIALTVFLALCISVGVHALRIPQWPFENLLFIGYLGPIIIIGPIISAIIPPPWSALAIGIITIGYPIYSLIRKTLEQIASRRRFIGSAYGATNWKKMRHLVLPALIPILFTALRFSLPWATLGIMVGESLGSRSGFGVFILGTLSRSDAPRLWAACVIVFAVIGGISWIVHQIENRLQMHYADSESTEDATAPIIDQSMFGVTFVFVLVLCALQVADHILVPQSSLVIGPQRLFEYFRMEPGELWAMIAAARSTIWLASVGLAVSLVTGIIWGALPRNGTPAFWLSATLLPFQFIPIVAGVPLLGLLFGRTDLATVFVVVLATVYPIYINVATQLASVPPGLGKLPKLYDARLILRLRYVYKYWLILGAIRGFRAAAPRAVLGAVLSESFLTGGGLGWFVYEARGKLHFEAIWLALTFVILFALLLDALVHLAERQVTRLTIS